MFSPVDMLRSWPLALTEVVVAFFFFYIACSQSLEFLVIFQSWKFGGLFVRGDLCPRMALNSWPSSCLSLQRIQITGVCHYAQSHQ